MEAGPRFRRSHPRCGNAITVRFSRIIYCGESGYFGLSADA
jgi:hypothetical protein